MNWPGPKNLCAKSEEFSVFRTGYLGPAPGWPPPGRNPCYVLGGKSVFRGLGGEPFIFLDVVRSLIVINYWVGRGSVANVMWAAYLLTPRTLTLVCHGKWASSCR